MLRKSFLSALFISLLFTCISADPDYTNIIQNIKNAMETDPDYKGHAYKIVSEIVDTFGPRLWGSPQLEDAINYMNDRLVAENFKNIKKEPVQINKKWVRGEESLIMHDPRPFPTKIPVIGLGRTVGGYVKAKIRLIKSKQELMNLQPGELSGKIALISQTWTNYDDVEWARMDGPSMAAQKGALACIIRSLAADSIENPHTGITEYVNGYEIPAAAISIESADMFERIIARGKDVVLELTLSGTLGDPSTSYNLIGEIVGTEKPEEIILMGGHIDSWDTGPQTGANDDAAGFMVCYAAMRTLIKLGLRPKRTIRFIAWSGEEFGEDSQGALQYIKDHDAELNNHVVVFESDEGTTHLYGFGITGTNDALNVITQIQRTYLTPLGVNTTGNDGEMVDSGYINDATGIPMMKNIVKDTVDQKYYFTYHHSAGDTVSILDSDDLDSNVAAIAAMFYIIADSDNRLPRTYK